MLYKAAIVSPILYIFTIASMPDPATLSTLIITVLGAIGFGLGLGYTSFMSRAGPARIKAIQDYDEAHRVSLTAKLEQSETERNKAVEEREEMRKQISANATRIDKLVSRNEELSDDLSEICIKILEKRGFGVVGVADAEAKNGSSSS